MKVIRWLPQQQTIKARLSLLYILVITRSSAKNKNSVKVSEVHQTIMKYLLTYFVVGIVIYGVEPATFFIPVEYHKNGQPFVEYNNTQYPIVGNKLLTYRDKNGCIVQLSLNMPSEEELLRKSGYVQGSILCLPIFP
ncbi:hypothetical protein CSKR_100935 [Clonorchis sinensis]|uniref:Uncharacterized protein n=2 Tax=Clonorchis sinensis TaxID=79923 RepID=G7Y7D8_CLOSI|nr:hypothetical protein CSKR_100935 [Clonorchis sinensis]GAA48873.1 hypothetical protein CLF_102156 [Clonorchis sinensis]